MPKITLVEDYNGFVTKANRLGLVPILEEATSALTSFALLVEEAKHANGTRGLRQKIDDAFVATGGWTKVTSGNIDWTKQNAQGASLGVEVQVSGRSDMLAVDVMHFKGRIESGEIDIGIIIVPDDELSRFLTDRTPNFATAKKHVSQWANDQPIRIVSFRHDGVGPALEKARTNLGKRPS